MLTGIALLVPFVIHSYRGAQPEIEKNPKKPTTTAIAHERTPVVFQDKTIQWQLFHEHRQESKSVSDIKDVLGPGLCIGDIDGDYLDDAVFVTGSGSTRTYGKKSWWLNHKNVTIYLNRGDHFELQSFDIDLSSSVATMGCLLADLNLDGLNDLVISSFKGSFLFKNLGQGFQEVPSFAKVAHRHWSTGITITDANNDGKPDLYLNHYLRYQKNQNTLELGSGFNIGGARHFDPSLYDGQVNQLLINKGHFEFEDQSKLFFDVNEQDRSLSTLAQDLNADGLEDLLVLNDQGNHARLYLKQASGKYTESDNLNSPFRLMATSYASTNRKGDLLVSRPSGLGLSYFEPEAGATSRYLDTAWLRAINKTERLTNSYWGSAIADFNLDGREDLFITTGLRSSDNYAHKRSIQQRDLILIQNDKGFVADATIEMDRYSAGRSVGTADFNMDGKADVLIANNNAAAKLMMNESETPHPWIALKSISPISTLFELKQKNLQSSISLKTSALFLGSQSSFQIIPLASEDKLEIVVQGKSYTLTPRAHYVFNNHDFVEVRKPKVEADAVKQNESLFLTKARIFRILQQGVGKLKHSDVEQIEQAIEVNPNFASYILQLPPKIELLHLYLKWIDHTHLSDAAWSNIKALESDTSIEYLIARLPQLNTQAFCDMSEVFTFWFDEEEAAIKTKYLAVPFFIRALQEQDPVRVACAANALGASEHLTASLSLIESYPTVSAPEAKMAIIRAAGLVRQRNIENHLLQIFKSEDAPRVKVEAAIAINRLDRGLGDELIKDYAENIHPSHLLTLLSSIDQAGVNVHFQPKTKAALIARLKPFKNQLSTSLHTLQADQQILAADYLELSVPPKQILSALSSDSNEHSNADMSFHRKLNQQLEKITDLSEDDAILFFSHAKWNTLPDAFKQQALSAIRDTSYRKLLSANGMVERAFGSLKHASVNKTSTAFNFLKEQPSQQALSLCDVFQAPQQIPSSVNTDFLSSEPIYLALQTATLIKHRQKAPDRSTMSDWISRQSEESLTQFFGCIAQMDFTNSEISSLAVWLLGLPEESEIYKQQWLLSSWAKNKSIQIVQSGISNRLKQKHLPFAERVLNDITPAELDPSWLSLMGQYREDSEIYQFAHILNHGQLTQR